MGSLWRTRDCAVDHRSLEVFGRLIRDCCSNPPQPTPNHQKINLLAKRRLQIGWSDKRSNSSCFLGFSGCMTPAILLSCRVLQIHDRAVVLRERVNPGDNNTCVLHRIAVLEESCCTKVYNEIPVQRVVSGARASLTK